MHRFRKAVQQVAPDDVIVANGDDRNVMSLRGETRGRWITFGWDRRHDASASDAVEAKVNEASAASATRRAVE